LELFAPRGHFGLYCPLTLTPYQGVLKQKFLQAGYPSSCQSTEGKSLVVTVTHLTVYSVQFDVVVICFVVAGCQTKEEENSAEHSGRSRYGSL